MENFLVSYLKSKKKKKKKSRTGPSAEWVPTSAFSSITPSTFDFPHVQVLPAPLASKGWVGSETKHCKLRVNSEIPGD